MKYLRTVKATSWQKGEPVKVKLLRKVLWFIPSPNRENEKKFHLLYKWLIEFDDDGFPVREIGIDKSGQPILASDTEDGTFGFWLDTNMKYSDFLDSESSVIDNIEFMDIWDKFNSST